MFKTRMVPAPAPFLEDFRTGHRQKSATGKGGEKTA